MFYCKDAFEGLATMDRLIDPAQREDFLDETIDEAYEEAGKKRRKKKKSRSGEPEKTVEPAPDIPTPPFWGPKTIEEMPLEIVLQHLHKPELFRLSWGAKNTRGEEWEKLKAEFEARLQRMTKEIQREDTLHPQAVYGYFPANSDGDDLIIWDYRPFQAAEDGQEPEKREVERLRFPRQPDKDFLCISDYFAPVDSGKVDICVLQVVTVGDAATEKFNELQSADNYSEAYFFHGLAVQAAEATANFVNRHVRRELDIPDNRGLRYSWGYPACPDLADHEIVFRLLPQASDDLGLNLTPSYQIVPEQSTAAIYTHHPAAKYYSVGNLDRATMILGED